MVHGHALPFFIYEDPAFDHSSLIECIPGWMLDDQAAEVPMLQLLQSHPARVLEPASASLFVLPIFPYVSYLAEKCGGLSHDERMQQAGTALENSIWYRRNLGADHLLVTNTFRLNTLRSFRGLLTRATVAWFESPTAPRRGPGRLAAAAFWRCTIVIPYLATPFCRQQLATRPTHPCTATSANKQNSVFFQGSMSAAAAIRRHIPSLSSIPGARIVEVPRWSMNTTTNGETCERSTSATCATKLEFARRMLCSEFCLIPRGDTPTSSRMYSAIACGCVPLILSDDFIHHLPFTHRVNYSFLQFVPERDFFRDAVGAVQSRMDILRPQLPTLRRLMRGSARDLLFDEEGSRVAANMLAEYAHSCHEGIN